MAKRCCPNFATSCVWRSNRVFFSAAAPNRKSPMHHDITRPVLSASALVLAALSATVPAHAQALQGFGICVPSSQRGSREIGCFIQAEQSLGALEPAQAYWHITRFDSRAPAERENAAATVKGTVVDAFGNAWLLTIADSGWRPRTGDRTAVIGPLPIERGVSYAALYMEASMRPGMKSNIHRHSGPEAWYTLQGATCLETPNATYVGRPGTPPVIVPGGPPMELTATGTAIRKALVLILHDASRPPTMMDSTWKPRGRCTADRDRSAP